MHLRRNDLMAASSIEKNAIMLLNELYYESAVYTEIKNEHLDENSCLVNVAVDGITTYGRGSSRKEAKVNAASAAVQQLQCLGLLQQRITEKESAKAGRSVAAKPTDDKPVPYRYTLCPVVPENAVAKLNRLYRGICYNTIDTNTTVGHSSYTVSANVNGQEFTGSGRSKKSARLAAAESALRALNNWTAEDDSAKRQAQAVAAQALRLIPGVNASGRPVIRGPRVQAHPGRFQSTGSVRGNLVPRGRGVGQGSLLDTSAYPSDPFTSYAHPGRGRGPGFRPRGSGMLSRGTRGSGSGARGADTNIVGQIENKNAVMLLNEVYYAAAEYQYSTGDSLEMNEPTQYEQYCTVTVDGITAYGTGHTRKDAKLNAAISAVQQLKDAGILQQRLTDKAAFMSQKYAVHSMTKYYNSQWGAVPVRMNRGRPVAARGRSGQARGQGRGLSRGSIQSWYPQKASADYNTDFTSLDNTSFLSFEGTMPSRGTLTGGQIRNPRMANNSRRRRPGQMIASQ